MYSGGLDSCGALYRLLTHADYENSVILVHHVQLKNHESRFIPEKNAVDSTLIALKTYAKRAFYYSESAIDFQFLPYPSNIPHDADCIAFVAGNLVNIDSQITHVAWGDTKDDLLFLKLKYDQYPKRMQAVFQSLSLDRQAKNHAKFIRPVGRYTKAEVWKMLPEDLRERCFSCRRPIYHFSGEIQPCWKCMSCEHILEARTSSF